MMAEKHRAAAAVKNGMSLSADPTDAMPKLNQKTDTIHDRIINHSDYKEVLLELAGDKKKERALKMVNGNAKTKPKIRTTGA